MRYKDDRFNLSFKHKHMSATVTDFTPGTFEKTNVPSLSDQERLKSIQSQRESICKILADLDRQQLEIIERIAKIE
jgi:hypothetical protein